MTDIRNVAFYDSTQFFNFFLEKSVVHARNIFRVVLFKGSLSVNDVIALEKDFVTNAFKSTWRSFTSLYLMQYEFARTTPLM